MRQPKIRTPRAPRDQTFRKTDITRAYRAAMDVGIVNPRIEIDRHGTISIVAGKPTKSDVGDDVKGAGEWDKI
jgi:hypothetical protein